MALSSKAFNPKGAVPTMHKTVDGGGLVLTESLAILFYIAAQTPAARLAADADDGYEQARMNEIMSELASEVHKAFVPTLVLDR